MSQSFGGLPPAITSDICERLVRAVRLAYEANAPLWSTSIGHDSRTYGQMLFPSIWHFLEEELKTAPGVECFRTGNSFEVHVGGCVIKSYKLGRSEHDDLDYFFPSNEDATMAMALENLEQLRLLPNEPLPSALVLGHQGNAVTGVAAVYLLAPLTNGASYEWALKVRIDRPAAGQSAAVTGPAPVPIAPPSVRPRVAPQIKHAD